MTTQTLPEPPAQLKAIHAFIKMAQDVERVDPVVSYWIRLYSTEQALKIDKDSPECKSFLTALIMYLEKFKSSNKDNETVSNQTVGQAHYENFVMALFNKADSLDREGTANKSTVRMFFMAAVLFEAMAVFGPITDEISQKAKYAKFKAAYITKCLRAGQTPKPGPIEGSDLEAGGASDGPTASTGATSGNDTGLNIPEVPTGLNRDPSFTKPPQEPFILNPSTPPASVQPKMPPSLPPGSMYSMNDSMTSRPTQPRPSGGSTSSTSTTTPGVCDQSKSSINDTRFLATNGAQLKPEDMVLGQKYCKFANSALQYDDIPTAVANLQKALKLLTTGEHPVD